MCFWQNYGCHIVVFNMGGTRLHSIWRQFMFSSDQRPINYIHNKKRFKGVILWSKFNKIKIKSLNLSLSQFSSTVNVKVRCLNYSVNVVRQHKDRCYVIICCAFTTETSYIAVIGVCIYIHVHYDWSLLQVLFSLTHRIVDIVHMCVEIAQKIRHWCKQKSLIPIVCISTYVALQF